MTGDWFTDAVDAINTTQQQIDAKSDADLNQFGNDVAKLINTAQDVGMSKQLKVVLNNVHRTTINRALGTFSQNQGAFAASTAALHTILNQTNQRATLVALTPVVKASQALSSIITDVKALSAGGTKKPEDIASNLEDIKTSLNNVVAEASGG